MTIRGALANITDVGSLGGGRGRFVGSVAAAPLYFFLCGKALLDGDRRLGLTQRRHGHKPEEAVCHRDGPKVVQEALPVVAPPVKFGRDLHPGGGRCELRGIKHRVKYRSSVHAREPQNPTKSEEYRKHLQGVLYST
eukprot:9480490-Pyramimonas_sp.AAC.2